MTVSFESKDISESELSEADKLSIGEEINTVDRRNLGRNTITSNKLTASIEFKSIKSVLDQ